MIESVYEIAVLPGSHNIYHYTETDKSNAESEGDTLLRRLRWQLFNRGQLAQEEPEAINNKAEAHHGKSGADPRIRGR